MAKEPPNLMEFARTANAGAPKLRSAVPTQRPPAAAASVAAAPAIPAAPAMPRDPGAVVLALAPPAPSSYVPSAPQQQHFAVPRAQPSPVGAVVLATAGVLGVLLSLYRNDVFYGLTHASRFQNQYLGFEHALGSPGFGTPRSLDPLVHVSPPAAVPDAPSTPANVVAQAPEAKPSTAGTSKEAAAKAAEADQAAGTEAESAPAPATKARAKSVATAPRPARATAKHAAAESEEEAPVKKAAATEPDEELPKKKANPFGLPGKADAKKADAKKAPEPKDTAPTLDLNDAIKASMEKKSH